MSKYLITLVGARRDYDVARLLDKEGMLERLVIDGYYNTKRYPLLKVLNSILPKQVVNTYVRYDPRISAELIDSSWITGIEFKLRMFLNKNGAYYKTQIAAYKQLNEKAISYLAKNKKQVNIFGFDTASLELFEWVRSKDLNTRLILEQCVASRLQQIEMYLFFKERFNLSNLDRMIEHCNVLRERELKEWHYADKIIVPSSFVKEGLVREGISEDKIELLPYGFTTKNSLEDIREHVIKKSNRKNSKITVLFAGNAGYRKGVHDLLKVAGLLINENIEFRIAGKIEATFSYNEAGRNVVFLGKLNRDELQKEYLNADVFFFPSYLEGSALVVYEAMSFGLPCIVTNQAGSVIKNGVDGFVMQAGDTSNMLQGLMKIANEPELRITMALNATENARNYSLDVYNQKLLQILK